MTEQQTELFDQSKATCLGMFSIPVGQIEVADGFLNPTREFIESVREFGVLAPITVKKMPSEDGIVDHYEVIMGRRRVSASRIVGLENIDAVVYEAGEWNYALLTLIENQQRSRNPIAE